MLACAKKVARVFPEDETDNYDTVKGDQEHSLNTQDIQEAAKGMSKNKDFRLGAGLIWMAFGNEVYPSGIDRVEGRPSGLANNRHPAKSIVFRHPEKKARVQEGESVPEERI